MSDPLYRVLSDINKRRSEIIENFIQTWLAVNMPDNADREWFINNCELVENRADVSKIIYSVRIKVKT